MSKTSINNFKNALNNLSWASVLNSNDTNESFELFLNDFFPLFNLYLPLKTKIFNKNFVKINDFFTPGLLISRITKNKLHKNSIKDPTPLNITKYKNYRNIFNSTLRKSKKLYYETNFLKYKKKQKKHGNCSKRQQDSILNKQHQMNLKLIIQFHQTPQR